MLNWLVILGGIISLITIGIATACICRSLGTNRGAWGGLVPLIGYILFYYAEYPATSPNTRLILLYAGILLELVAIISILPVLRLMWSNLAGRQKWLLIFIFVYISTYPLAWTVGVSPRVPLENSLMMLTSALIGVVMSAADLRRTILVSLCIGTILTVTNFMFRGSWIPGQPLYLDYAPVTFDMINMERRLGVVPPLADYAALLAICVSGGLMLWLKYYRFSSFVSYIAIFAVMMIIFTIYLFLSQFRYVLISGMTVLLAAVVLRVLRGREKLLTISVCVFVLVLLPVMCLSLFYDELSFWLTNPFLGRGSFLEADIRFELYRRTWSIFLQSPVLGWGISSNTAMMQRLGLEIFGNNGAIISTAHSGHMVILSEIGIIGIIGWLYLWGSTFFDGLKYALRTYSNLLSNFWVVLPFFISLYSFVWLFFHGALYVPWVWYALSWQFVEEKALASQPVRTKFRSGRKVAIRLSTN